jgi:hypothetical protein
MGREAAAGERIAREGTDANREIEAAQKMVDSGVNRANPDPYNFAPGTDHLPPQLGKSHLDGYNPWNSTNHADGTVITRDADPASHPLYRSDTRPLDQIIQEGGLQPRSPGNVTWEAMAGHVGGNTHSGFTSSTSDILESVRRGKDADNPVSWIYKHHSPGGIDVDATTRYHGETWGHSESEILHPGVRLQDIAGAWKRTRVTEWIKDGGYDVPRTTYKFEWHENPYFAPQG